MRIKKVENFGIILNYLEEYREKTGGSPTVREIERGTGIPHATVTKYLQEMRENGDISFDGHRNIVTRKARDAAKQMYMAPLVGRIACGIPNLAEENIEEYVPLPASFFGKGKFFILRAFGESMIDIGVEPGDLVVIRQQPTAEPGEIVVALVDNEATLKRYYPEPEKHRVRLHPENASMEDIYVKSCDIQGVAVKVIKDLK